MDPTSQKAPSLSGSDTQNRNSDRPYVDMSIAVRQEPSVNAMSVDVEEHFQVSAFESQVGKSSWRSCESRVARNMDRLFHIFDEAGVKATFFTLGWVAERAPEIIKKITAEGHELASHGYDHARVSSMTPDEFLADVSRTKKILEDIAGESVIGYRAPSFSIGGDTLWAHDLLQEAGYRYSSSIYPIKHDHYGLPTAPRFPFRFTKNGLLEIPLTTATFAGRNMPCAGGGYFRLLPMTYTQWAFRKVNNVEKMPVAFYFHPWEIDPQQPRVSGIPLVSRFRHYVNLDIFERRLKTMLGKFRWGRMIDVYGNALSFE